MSSVVTSITLLYNVLSLRVIFILMNIPKVLSFRLGRTVLFFSLGLLESMGKERVGYRVSSKRLEAKILFSARM